MKRFSPAVLVLLLAALACGSFQVRKPPGPIVQPIWEVDNTFDANSIVYFDGAFYALGDAGSITALDESTGQVIWQAPADTMRLSRDATVIYAAVGESCSALDAATGTPRETFAPIPRYLCDPTRLDDSNLNFTLGEDGSVSAWDAESGAPIWHASRPLGLTFSSIFEVPPASPPYIWRGHVIAYTITFHEGDANTEYLNFQVLDPETGAIEWELTDKPFGEARLQGDTVILAYADVRQVEPTAETALIPQPAGPFQLVARDLATGVERWHVVTGYGDDYYTDESTLYQCNDGSWRSWDLASGELLSEQDESAPHASYSCPNSNSLGSVPFLGHDVWLVEGIRTTENNPDFENPILDGWYTAYRVSTGETLWSTDALIAQRIGIAAMGRSVVLTIQDTKLRAYLLIGLLGRP